MIKGSAGIEATHAHAGNFTEGAFQKLGRTGLSVSAVGFGGYRVSPRFEIHGHALRQCLTAGVNLIDTSSNYADGGSEILIGLVLGDLIDKEVVKREDVVLVSKVGYLQGQNYDLSQNRKLEGKPFPDLVTYAEGLEHCIHPEFIEDQLTRSLQRLQCETIDVYLLHNPEYFLSWAKRSGLAQDRAEAVYYERLEKAFKYLEHERGRGRIQFYGVSSNTFPAETDAPDFTSLSRLWSIAEGLGPDHGFAVIQFPMNLIERGAAVNKNQDHDLTLLAKAREVDLGVLINRPLNAAVEGRLFRLAEAETFIGEKHPQIDQLKQNVAAIKAHVAEVDPDWGAETLSGSAIRALRSSAGIHTVLVGMRIPSYVEDVLSECRRPVACRDRASSWSNLRLA